MEKDTSKTKIKDFTDLLAWKESHKLVLSIYKLTKELPESEKFGLVSQMTRCAVSITSNIAEGFGRFTYKERIRFYYISVGSIAEIKNQLIIAKDLKYISEDEVKDLFDQIDTSNKLIKGLIRSTKSLDTTSI